MLFNSTSVKFQRIMEGIGDDKLDVSRTLIFYQGGFNFKSIQKRFKQITKIRMNDSPNKVAEIIELFIKLHKLSSKYKMQSVLSPILKLFLCYKPEMLIAVLFMRKLYLFISFNLHFNPI